MRNALLAVVVAVLMGGCQDSATSSGTSSSSRTISSSLASSCPSSVVAARKLADSTVFYTTTTVRYTLLDSLYDSSGRALVNNRVDIAKDLLFATSSDSVTKVGVSYSEVFLASYPAGRYFQFLTVLDSTGVVLEHDSSCLVIIHSN